MSDPKPFKDAADTAAFLDLTDAELGKWTREAIAMIQRLQRKGLEEKHMGLQCTPLFLLIHDTVDSNSEYSRFRLNGPTIRGKANIGDWEIVVRRLHPFWHRVRTFFRDLKDRFQRRERLETVTSNTGFAVKWTAADGRDKTDQILNPPKDTLH
jgi:hypothetical protein